MRMQPLMYSHAILAWWGQSVYLSLADHDEYLALARPDKIANVQDLMAQCFDDLAQVAHPPPAPSLTPLSVVTCDSEAHTSSCTLSDIPGNAR